MRRLLFGVGMCLFAISALFTPPIVAAGDDKGMGDLTADYKVGDKIPLSKSVIAEYVGKDAKGDNIWQSVIDAPKFATDTLITPINCYWMYIEGGGYWLSGANLFSASVFETGKVDVNYGMATWQPQIEIHQSANVTTTLTMGTARLLLDDWQNPNYRENTIEIPYYDGAMLTCRRQLRLIEGMLLEYYIFDAKPKGDIVIRQNVVGDASIFPPAEAWDGEGNGIPIQVNGDIKLVQLADLAEVVLPIIIDPSPTFVTSASDGYYELEAEESSAATSWNVAHDSASSAIVWKTRDQSSVGVNTKYDTVPGPSFYATEIQRGALFFDTSGLPDGITVTAATLDVYIDWEHHEFSTWGLTIQSGMPTYPSDPIVNSDYLHTHWTGDGGSRESNLFTEGAYNTITLNAQGRGWINLTGVTKFVLREDDHDIDDVQPGTYATDDTMWNAVDFWAYEKGNGFWPYLTVTYVVVAATVTTDAAQDVACTTATLWGTIVDDGGDTIDHYGFVWDDDADEGDPGDVDPSGPPGAWDWGWKSGAGDYGETSQSHGIAGLANGTTYYFRFAAHNSIEWTYGDVQQFTTFDLPTVTTVAASSVTADSARLNAFVNDDGGAPVEVRFGYGTTSQACTCGNYDTCTGYTGSHSTGDSPYYDISGLSCNVTYFFCVEGQNACGTDSGGELSFATANCTIGAPDYLVGTPTDDEVALTWVRGDGSSGTEIRYTEGCGDSCPTANTTGWALYEGAATYTTATGLDAGTTYCFKAWGYAGSTWSTANITLCVTTLGVGAEGDEIPLLTEPTGWFADPDEAGMSNFMLYQPVNAIADYMGMPRGTFWFLLAVGVATALGVLVGVSTHSLLWGTVVLTIGLATGWAADLLPLWIPAVSAIFILAAGTAQRKGYI